MMHVHSLIKEKWGLGDSGERLMKEGMIFVADRVMFTLSTVEPSSVKAAWFQIELQPK